jgi:hypothetical protein
MDEGRGTKIGGWGVEGVETVCLEVRTLKSQLTIFQLTDE